MSLYKHILIKAELMAILALLNTVKNERKRKVFK